VIIGYYGELCAATIALSQSLLNAVKSTLIPLRAP
jgi:hypothetical protein